MRTGRGLCCGDASNFVNVNLGHSRGGRFIYGYSSVSSVVVFCGSNGCGIVHITRGICVNGGIRRVTMFIGGSGHAVCGIICHRNGFASCCVGHFTIGNIAHSGRCSLARNRPNSGLLCFSTAPGNRSRAVHIVLGTAAHHIGGLSFRGGFSRCTVGNHRSGNGQLAGFRIDGVRLGRHNASALNNSSVCCSPSILHLGNSGHNICLNGFSNSSRVLIIAEGNRCCAAGCSLGGRFSSGVLHVRGFGTSGI